MPKRKNPTTQALTTISETDHRLNGGCAIVRVDSVIRSPDVHPSQQGPWSIEADKIAWFDAATGYGCIIRRAANGGHLCGYVGVGPDHPVFGYLVAALRGVGIRAHGGIDYAAPCERPETERATRSIVRRRAANMDVCHEPPPTFRTTQHTTKQGRTVLEVSGHDDLWWIGFSCNQPTDVIPDPRAPGADMRHLPSSPNGLVERRYRDEAYVFDQCIWLAAQLKAIDLGGDPSDVVGRWIPALGFDPRSGRN